VSNARPHGRRHRGTYESLRRWFRFRLLIPVFRSPHSPQYTALGVANGVFWGLTPTIGLQTVEILSTWFVARTLFRRDSSVVQALIWVWVNNPLTMIPMYYVFYLTGVWMMGDATLAKDYAPFVDLWTNIAEGNWFARLVALTWDVGIATLVGCIPYAFVGSAISYRWALAVVRARKRRVASHARLAHERSVDETAR
jgi:uncharacterized protein (DUF2062 family)